MSSKKSPYIITYDEKKYAIDIESVLKACMVSKTQSNREKEITNVYNRETSEEDIYLSSKVERELKTDGDPQNDVIAWDFIKLMVEKLIYNEAEFPNEDMGTALAMNTLIRAGILVEVENE